MPLAIDFQRQESSILFLTGEPVSLNMELGQTHGVMIRVPRNPSGALLVATPVASRPGPEPEQKVKNNQVFAAGGKWRKNKALLSDVIARVNSGAKTGEIAKEFGVARTTVQRWRQLIAKNADFSYHKSTGRPPRHTSPTEPRICRDCNIAKPLTVFRRNRTQKFGRSYQCIECHRLMQERNADVLRERGRRYYRTHIDKAMARRRAESGGEKDIARWKLRAEVAAGRKVKPNQCEGCLQVFPLRRIQGHHEDYSKPFDVRWLCQKCHGLLHREPINGA